MIIFRLYNWSPKQMNFHSKTSIGNQNCATSLYQLLNLCPCLVTIPNPSSLFLRQHQLKRSKIKVTNPSAKGAFTNYVDQILSIFDHLPTPGWYLWRNFFTVIGENLHTVDISSTTYLPRLVNVVCECPPLGNLDI